MIKQLDQFFLARFKPESEWQQFRARLLVRFALITALFSFLYVLITFFTGFITGRYVTGVCFLLMMVVLFGMRSGISLLWASHLFVFFCWSMISLLALFSQGIHSVALPWICLIPVVALLLMGRRIVWYWGAVGLATMVFFFVAENNIVVSPVWQAPFSSLRTLSLNIGLLAMTLALIYIFHRKGVELLETVRKQNEDLGSARKVIEKQRDEIVARNENLEVEVDKRTKELLEYNQQLQQFAFIASHNLRAPVASLLGLGNLLEVSAANREEVEQICLNMITTARELDRVVRDLSTILDIRKTSHALLAEIDLEEEVRLVCVSLDREFRETMGELRTDFSQVPTVQTVRPLMDSILTNLISNAIKYRHPDRTPRIMLRTEQKGEEVCLSVSDNGLGLDLAAYRDKLFTLYGRFHSHVDGKGLGLYLVKTHVTSMGGRIEVDSEPNQGTTFRVFLRLTKAT